MAKFSKQDYVSIAQVIKATWSDLFRQAPPGIRTWQVGIDHAAVVLAFADVFEQDNPNFDRGRFMDACEVDQ